MKRFSTLFFLAYFFIFVSLAEASIIGAGAGARTGSLFNPSEFESGKSVFFADAYFIDYELRRRPPCKIWVFSKATVGDNGEILKTGYATPMIDGGGNFVGNEADVTGSSRELLRNDYEKYPSSSVARQTVNPNAMPTESLINLIGVFNKALKSLDAPLVGLQEAIGVGGLPGFKKGFPDEWNAAQRECAPLYKALTDELKNRQSREDVKTIPTIHTPPREVVSISGDKKYALWKNINVGMPAGVADVRIRLSGVSAPILSAQRPFVVERTGAGEVVLYASRPASGVYSFKVLLSSNSPTAALVARVEANIDGRPVSQTKSIAVPLVASSVSRVTAPSAVPRPESIPSGTAPAASLFGSPSSPTRIAPSASLPNYLQQPTTVFPTQQRVVSPGLYE